MSTHETDATPIRSHHLPNTPRERTALCAANALATADRVIAHATRLQVGPATWSSPALTRADAVYIVALSWVMEERFRAGERVSLEAAARIAVLATALGFRPASSVEGLGFHVRYGVLGRVHHSNVVHALFHVVETACVDAVYRICRSCESRNVAELERMETDLEGGP